MFLPLRTLRDPLPQRFDLVLRQRRSRGRRRHPSLGIGAGYAFEHFACIRLAGRDGEVTAAIAAGAFLSVKMQIGFTLGYVRAVAVEADVGEDRANVAVEFDRA